MIGFMIVLAIVAGGFSIVAFAWGALFHGTAEKAYGIILIKLACILLVISILALFTSIGYSGGWTK